ncbi:MAG: diaminopropionate ammonia-lyase, partial [Octadecabacter sp.]
ASIKASSPQITSGPSSDMGRLDCKEPSLIALKGLTKDADGFMLITEAEGATGSEICAAAGFASTPSGAAGVAGLIAAKTDQIALGLTKESRVLVILSEEAG